MKLDISHFKKIKEDQHSATLQHPEGHQIKVAKGSLNSSMKAKLAALPHYAEGGDVGAQDQEIIDRMNTPATSRPTTDWGLYYDAMHRQQPSAEMPQEASMQQPDANRAPAGIGADIGAGLRGAYEGVKDAAGNVANYFSDKGPVLAPVLNEGKDFIGAATGKPYQSQVEPDEEPEEAKPSGISKTNASNFNNSQLLGGLNANRATASVPESNLGSNLAADYAKQERGITNEAKHLGQLGQEEVGYAEQANSALNKAKEDYQTHYNDLNTEIKNTVQDIQDSHIDSNHYMNSKSTGSRIATAIGLILGGLGGGLLRQENPALKFLNQNIDRDIEGQKEELGKKNSILSAYYNQTKNLNDATMMTRAFYMEKYANDLKKAAANSQDPLVKDRADQALGKLDLEKHQILDTLAKKQAVLGLAKNGGAIDPSVLVQHLVPKEHQAQVFKEIGAAQNTVRMGDEIKHAFEQAAQENTVMRTGAGLLRTPGSVYALHQAMQPTFADLEGTVRQAAMDNTFTNITPQPGDSDHKIAQKRRSLMNYLQSKEAAPTAAGYGINLSNFPSTASTRATRR